MGRPTLFRHWGKVRSHPLAGSAHSGWLSPGCYAQAAIALLPHGPSCVTHGHGEANGVISPCEARPILKSSFKLADKVPALTLLGKHVGLFPISAKFEHVGANGGPIATENKSANKDQGFEALFAAMTKPEQYRVLDALAVVLEVNEMVRVRL